MTITLLFPQRASSRQKVMAYGILHLRRPPRQSAILHAWRTKSSEQRQIRDDVTSKFDYPMRRRRETMAENWIRTDESGDVAGSIRHVLLVSRFVKEDPLAWKWIILALHSALQGACVCHLTTTFTPVGAVTEKNALEWLEYIDASRANPKAKRPKTYLMALPDLLKAVRKPNSAGDRSNAVGIEISDAELRWLQRFHNDVRNQFVHFEPTGWSLEVSGIPELAKLVTRIIEEILQVGWAFRFQEHHQRGMMLRNLREIALIEWAT